MPGIVAALAFVLAIVGLSRFLRRREREGDWDKEGYGTPEHPEPGVMYRRLEVPPKAPFD